MTKYSRFFYNPAATVGLIVVAFIVVISILAPLLPLIDPDETSLADRLLRPGAPKHLLGTDDLGRDLLSRLVWGTGISLAVGLSATLIAALIGSLIGILAAFYGAPLDNILMRGIDMLMAFPYLLLALAIVAVLGPGLFNALIAISIINIPFFARNVRGATLSIVQLEYIHAARVSGLSDRKILLTELLPNVLPVIFITISTTVGWMILETAGLSFLGLGAQPPQADLGSMLGNGRRLILTAPHVAALPGLVILILVIGINLVGDGLRDILDPYLRAGTLISPQPLTRTSKEIAQRARQGTRPKEASNNSRTATGTGAGTGAGTGQYDLTITELKTHFHTGGAVLRAVDGASLFVPAGTTLGVMGESGSGKSVTALSVLGLVPSPPGIIESGSVQYQGRELLGQSLPVLQSLRGNRISYIFQNPMTALNPVLNVGEQIIESICHHQGLQHAEARARAIALMEQVHIPNAASRMNSYPHELSGGMRQRLVIAIALANNPDIIIADEPTTALDVTIQAQILHLLKELQHSRGLSLLFISHDFGVISQICDRIVVMYAGQVVESGTVEEIQQFPLHPYTRRLMDCVPQIGEEKVLNPIQGLPPALDKLPHGCRFAARCNFATDACRAAAVPLISTEGRDVRCIRTKEIV